MKIFFYVFLGWVLAATASYAGDPQFPQVCNSHIPLSTPDSRFTINGDGTVTDMAYPLMWSRCRAGWSGNDCATGSDFLTNFQTALDLATSSTLAGFDDWRLPNYFELMSIVEDACAGPAINLTVFPGIPSNASVLLVSSSPNPAVNTPTGRPGGGIAVDLLGGKPGVFFAVQSNIQILQILLVRDIPVDPES